MTMLMTTADSGGTDTVYALSLAQDLAPMIQVGVAACLVVLVAIIIDLCSGWAKASARGVAHTSYALKRTANKFMLYEGSMAIALGVDVLTRMSRLKALLGVDVLDGVPFVTCMMGIFFLVVEFMSVREKADEKMKAEMGKVTDITKQMVSRAELVDALAEAVRTAADRREREKESDRTDNKTDYGHDDND